MTDLSITNAKLVLPSGEHGSCGVRCSGDRIEAVGDVETCSDAFDAKGAILAPAIVDLGVFAIDKPAFTEAIGAEAMGKLTAFYETFAALDGVKEYLARRKKVWGLPGSRAQPA